MKILALISKLGEKDIEKGLGIPVKNYLFLTMSLGELQVFPSTFFPKKV